MGTILRYQEKIQKNGVFPPGGCVINSLGFWGLMPPVFQMNGQGQSFKGFALECIDEAGTCPLVYAPL